jgi:hypothetical protein
MSKPRDYQPVYGDSTFKTGIDLGSTAQPRRPSIGGGATSLAALSAQFEEELMKLPNVVNYVALRETFLSEAPFIKRSNRKFWKRWIDSKQYLQVLGSSLRILTDCITDNGVVYAGKLFQIPKDKNKRASSAPNFDGSFDPSDGIAGEGNRGTLFLSRTTMVRLPTQQSNSNNSNTGASYNNNQASFQQWLSTIDLQAVLMEKIAINISEMLLMDRDKKGGVFSTTGHDMLFSRLPELLSYMSIQALIATIPKLSRIFNSVKFRELLLDWFTELINGMKITNCHIDREWLFKNSNENPLILIGEPTSLSKSYRKFGHTIQSQQEKRKNIRRLPSLGDGGSSRSRSPDNFHNHSNISSPFMRMSTGNMTPFTPQGTSTSGRPQQTVTFDQTNNSNNINRFASTTYDSYDTNVLPSKMTESNKNNDNNSLASSASSVSTSLPALQNSRYSSAKSTMILQHSPLVQLYLNMGREESSSSHYLPVSEERGVPSASSDYVCQNPLKLTMTHLPNRPIVSMQSHVVHQEGKFREKKMNHTTLKKVIKESKKNRESILENKEATVHQMKYDIHKMRKAYKIQIALLEKKPVTQKELLLAATAYESIKMSGNTPNGGTNHHLQNGLNQGSGFLSHNSGDFLSGGNSVMSNES